MFNKNRKEIKKLWIQLDRDKHLLAMLKEEYDISADEFEQYVISNTIATIAKRIMAKRMEIENLKGQTSVYSFSLRKIYIPYNERYNKKGDV